MENAITEYGNIIPVLIFMAVIFMGSAVITGTMAYRNIVKTRLKVNTGDLSPETFQDKRKHSTEFVSKIGGALSNKNEESSDLRKKLTAAGFSDTNAIAIFLGIKMLLLFGALALSVVLYYTLNFSTNINVMIILFVNFVGFFLPNHVVGVLKNKRAKIFRNNFPDAIDLLEICVSGGMGMDAAWNSVTENLRPICPMLADEMSLTNLEMHLGSSRSNAMRNMADRASSPEVSSLVSAMVQSEKFGTSIGETLRTFAINLRTERSQKAEESAEKMPVKMLFPMVCFVFPVVIIVAMGPAVLGIIDIFSQDVG